MRYLPLNYEDRRAMLARIGANSINDLFRDIPGQYLDAAPLDQLPKGVGEMQVERHIAALAEKNTNADQVAFFIGGGAYRHHVPATVDHLIQRSEFMTAYTPYQPEIAQGTLQTLFEFQTQVAELTGMEIANASMYDGASATAEAVLMAYRLTKRSKAVLAGGLHPQYREVVQTITHFSNHEVELSPVTTRENKDMVLNAIDRQTACVVVQMPDFFGNIFDLSDYSAAAARNGALLIAVFSEPFAFGVIEPPGAMGADIAVGEGQAIGNALNFGGPHIGLLACRKRFVRQMPGRLCGETVDTEGRRGFVLTLSAREQHIRRERATSNICTNSGLCALAFSIHATLLGAPGLRKVAEVCHINARSLADQLAEIAGVRVMTPTFFNEFTIEIPGDAGEVIGELAKRKVFGGVPVSRLDNDKELKRLIVVAATELNSPEDIEAYVVALKEVLK